MVSAAICAVIAIVVGVIAAAVGFFVGQNHRKKYAEAKIGSAEEEAKRIINDAIKTAQQKRKEAAVEAKDELFRMKAEADKEIKDRRADISRQEKRLDQKEENIDRKTAALEQKEEEHKKRAARHGRQNKMQHQHDQCKRHNRSDGLLQLSAKGTAFMIQCRYHLFHAASLHSVSPFIKRFFCRQMYLLCTHYISNIR